MYTERVRKVNYPKAAAQLQKDLAALQQDLKGATRNIPIDEGVPHALHDYANIIAVPYEVLNALREDRDKAIYKLTVVNGPGNPSLKQKLNSSMASLASVFEPIEHKILEMPITQKERKVVEGVLKETRVVMQATQEMLESFFRSQQLQSASGR